MRLFALLLVAGFLLASPASANHLKVNASVAAQNTFSDVLTVPSTQGNKGAATRVSVSISGTFVGTITLQRRLDGTNWRDVTNWTGETEVTYIADEDVDLRIGIKTGNYTSGTAVLRLGAH